MSSAAAVLGNIRFVRGSSTRASNAVSWDAEREHHMVAKAVACVATDIAPRPARGVVVELRPRNFTETAAHFLSIAKPVQWPIDEPDID
jgi:hypothetical protein